MTISIQQVSNTNTFYFWKSQTNLLANAMSNYVVTTNSNTAVGNAYITGTFGANTLNSNNLTVDGFITVNRGIYANGAVGSSGQVLTSNGAGTYWSSVVGSVTSVSSGAGLTGGQITTSGTIALDVYTGSSPTNTLYPVGTIVSVYAGNNSIRVPNQQDFIYTDNLNGVEGESGSLLGGVWRNRGLSGIDYRGPTDLRRYYLYQRVS